MFQSINRPAANTRTAFLVLIALQFSGCDSADRVQVIYERGAKLLAEHDNQNAAVEFRNAIKLKKDLIPAWHGLAKIEESNQHWQSLVPILRTILELDPKDLETRLKLTKLLLRFGDTEEEALKLVNGAEEKDNGNASLLGLKAAVFYKLKNYSGATREAQAALKADPGNVDAAIVLAADRLANGDPKGALQIIDSDLVDQKKDLGILLFKIKIFEQLRDLPQVELLLRKLTELYPQESAFEKQLIKFLVDQHRERDAEKEARAKVASDPNNSEAELELIHLLYTVMGPAPARQELVAGIDAGGDVFPYQIALAEFDFVQGNFVESFELLEFPCE